MKNASPRICRGLCIAGAAVLAVSLIMASVASGLQWSIPDLPRRWWEAMTVLLGCGCFAACATYRTFANQNRNLTQTIYALKLTGCIFAWFLIIQLTLRCF